MGQFHTIGFLYMVLHLNQKNRHLIGGLAVGVIGGAALGVSRHVLPVVFPHMQDSLHLSAGKMGALATGYFLSYMFSSYFWGHRSDRVGSKRVLLVCLFICTISLGLLGTFGSFPVLMSVSICVGIGAGGLFVPVISILVKTFSEEKRGKVISIFFLGEGAIVIALGLIVPLMVSHLSWRWVWWMSGGLCMIFAMATAALLKENKIGDRDSGSELRESSPSILPNFAVLKIPNILSISTVYFLHALARGAFITFVVVYLVQKGMSYRSAGGAFSLLGMGFIPGSFIAGYLQDRFRSYVFFGIVVLELVAVSMIIFFAKTVLIYAAVIIMGCCLTGIPTVVGTIMAEMAPKESYGQALGWLTFCLGMGTMISPTVAGFISEITDTLLSTQIFAWVSLSLASIVCIGMEQRLLRIRNRAKILTAK
jgi:AAHS family benzoate transporter-like MFS transporter